MQDIVYHRYYDNNLSPSSIKEEAVVAVVVVVVSVVMVVGLEVTLVVLVMTLADLARDLMRVEMVGSLTEEE